ncbi:MAG: nuclear transport factor 2 family protein [Actinobacteria bacterium]|nr:nuclear transport factor 2 family protein [Actinomycetota bacterium]
MRPPWYEPGAAAGQRPVQCTERRRPGRTPKAGRPAPDWAVRPWAPARQPPTLRAVGDDTQAIRNLVFRYAELVDAGDFGGVARLFADATYRSLTPEGIRVACGPAEVRAWMERSVRRYGDGTPGTRHLVTNLIIDVEWQRGTATCRSCYTVFQVVQGRLEPVMTGRYQDSFVREVDGWHFRDRLALADLIGDLTHHLTGLS